MIDPQVVSEFPSNEVFLEIKKFSLNNINKKGNRQSEAWGDEADVPRRTPGYLEFRHDGAFRVVLTDRKPPQKHRRPNNASAYNSYRVTVHKGEPMFDHATVKQTQDIVPLEGPGGWYKLRADIASEALVVIPDHTQVMTKAELRTFIKQLVDLI